MNKVFKREQKKLWSTYNKVLKKKHKLAFKTPTNPLEYFVTYLRYMRDYYILNDRYGKDNPEHLKVKALASAISAYEQSQQCIYKYYSVINGKIVQIAQGSSDEIKAKYAKERALHWGTFWQLVMLNIEDWLTLDGTV